MINKILFTACCVFVASSAFASASDFSALDANKDGLISKEEASVSKTVTQQWDLLDLNKDGYLGEKELAALTDYKK
ncbi:MAG: hypothetical protein OQL19_06445 [Gammaproteobacteria bacterium]|nr:hypothetical protein [Gammaproteobacteria bacterium]